MCKNFALIFVQNLEKFHKRRHYHFKPPPPTPHSFPRSIDKIDRLLQKYSFFTCSGVTAPKILLSSLWINRKPQQLIYETGCKLSFLLKHCDIALIYGFGQCCRFRSESGSTGSTCFWASGSTCFWASWILIRILLSLSKNCKKSLDFYCFVTFFLLFTFEQWCKSTFKKYYADKLFEKNLFFVGILKVNDENRRIRIRIRIRIHSLVRGMDPRIRIRIHTKCHGSVTLVLTAIIEFKNMSNVPSIRVASSGLWHL